jgi:hypothetical protein
MFGTRMAYFGEVAEGAAATSAGPVGGVGGADDEPAQPVTASRPTRQKLLVMNELRDTNEGDRETPGPTAAGPPDANRRHPRSF